MKLKFFTLLLCFGIMYTKIFSQAVNTQDSLALVNLFNSTNGPNWKKNTNWLTAKPVKTWYGITVTGTRVTVVNLQLNRLSGTLPASIGNLTEVTDFYLNANSLTGNIPPGIGNMIKLKFLALNNNLLSGSIPNQLGNLINIQTLYLNTNKLSGTLPPAITNLTKMSYLDISQNRLQGNITDSIGKLTSLYYVYADHNLFSGEISAAIATLHINSLYLSYNQFKFSGMELVAQTIPNPVYDHQKKLTIHQINNTLSVSAGGISSNNTYQWFMAGGSNTTITGDSTFHPAQSGAYYVQVNNSIATQLTLLSDTINYIADDTSLLHKIAAATDLSTKTKIFSVYPNPAHGKLSIQSTGKVTFTLTNAEGKMVATQIINGNGVMRLANLPAGMYYLKNTTTKVAKEILIEK